MSGIDLTQGLNPQQKEAVLKTEGPLLILAGAGSGKTRVITHRIAHIISSGLASPDGILAVTFTNKAAKEMGARIQKLLTQLEIPIYSEPWVSTFHSMAVRILRQHLPLLGYQPGFSIYDSDDQLKMIKQVLTQLNINDKIYPAKGFASKINNAKTQMLSPDDLAKQANYGGYDDRTLDVYENYERSMKQANALDFSDLLLKTYELFKNFPQILSQYQDRFQYIHVDEYQDTNRIQYMLIKMLAAKSGNLCVVGDEDQSIYSWRGADIRNILDFENDFEGAVVKLEKNYRSSANIVNAANAVISNNTYRKSKTLFTDNPEGEKITIAESNTEYDEARFVANHVEKFLNSSYSPSDIAVFYRTNAQSRVIEEQLRLKSIPYKIVGGTKFYERKEIKDIIAYLKALVNPEDDIAIKRIINVPARGIGKTTLQKIENLAVQDQCSFIKALQTSITNKVFNSGTQKKLEGFLNLIVRLQDKKDLPLDELYHLVLDDTLYIQKLREENTLESKSRIENLEELNNAIVQFCKERQSEASLQTFLEEMALVSDIDEVDDQWNSVTLMTLHISKGLEFPVVFLVGMEEGLFPGHQKINDADDTEMEEERRLCYVGMTRARERLFMLHARTRKVWGQDQFHPPSRFLSEVPDEFTNKASLGLRPKFMDQYGSGSYGSEAGYGSASGSYSSDYGGKSSSSGYGSSSYGKSANSKSSVAYGRKSITRKAGASPSKASYNPFPDYESGDSGYVSSSSSYKKGMRVKHPTFGFGSIYDIEGAGDSEKVSVLFNDNVIRKFVTKYARLEQV
ncbi:MAG: UvrD-helicase domain-containing protein [Bdellovibrionaceae bacterium]|nr:UvrD-helicase domain-containing protein [Pseudobdellovibrionaceae bacterium]